MNASKPHKRPVTRDGIALLIEDCERTSAALSMRPTPFQLEQAVNFLVSTVPAALRNLEEQLEASRQALVDLCEAVDAACDFDANTSVVDAYEVSSVLPPHMRSTLELSLQRARLVAYPAISREAGSPERDRGLGPISPPASDPATESVIERKAREQRESPRGAPPTVLPDAPDPASEPETT